MSIDKKITALAGNIDEKRAFFEGCNAALVEKQTTLKNLLTTRESLKAEAHHQSDEWERNLLASGGLKRRHQTPPRSFPVWRYRSWSALTH